MSPFDYQQALNRVEEKLAALAVTVSRLEERVEYQSRNIDRLGVKIESRSSRYITWLERLAWAGLSVLVWYLTNLKL